MSHDADRSVLTHPLARLWSHVLGQECRGPDNSFFDAGDSISAIRLVGRLRSDHGIDMTLAEFMAHPTLRALVERAAQPPGARPTPGSCLAPLAADGRPQAAFCFHAVAGTTTRYAALADELRGSFDVWGLQARGLRDGESHASSVAGMAREYLREIETLGHDGPHLFIGYSLGGMIAHEAARQIASNGGPAPALVLVDALPVVEPDRDPGYALRSLVRNALGLQLDVEQLRRLAPQRCSEIICQAAVTAGMLPPGTDPLHIRRMLLMYDAMRAAGSRHRTGQVDADALLFTASRAETGDERPTSATLGWDLHVRTVEVRSVPASHYDITARPAATRIAQVIEDRHARSSPWAGTITHRSREATP